MKSKLHTYTAETLPCHEKDNSWVSGSVSLAFYAKYIIPVIIFFSEVQEGQIIPVVAFVPML